MNKQKLIQGMDKTPANCHSCWNKDCSLLKHCDEKWIEFINSRKYCFYYKKGQQVIFERTPVAGMFFIYSGRVKLFKTGLNGRQQIVGFAKPGDIIGHRGLGKALNPVAASAIVDSRLCYIDKNDFEELLNQNPKLTYDLLLYCANELHHAEIRTRNMAQLSVREKVADALIRMHEAFKNGDEHTIEILLSRQEIAEIAGTTKEQVSKNLTDFKSEQIIDMNGKWMKILNHEKLNSLGGDRHELLW